MTTATEPATSLVELPSGAAVGRFEGDWLTAVFFRDDTAAANDTHPDHHHWYPVDSAEEEFPVSWGDVVTLRPGERLVRLYREDGMTKAFGWIAEEYRRCIVAARCTVDGTYYATCNGRAEAYRQAVEVLADLTGAALPDFEQIKRDVPADGIYRAGAAS